MKLKQFIKQRKKTAILLSLLIAGIVVFLSVPLPDPLFNTDYSTVCLDNKGQIIRVYLNSQEQWIFPPDGLNRVPDKLETALIQSEDAYFYSHFGVNPLAVIRAMIQNLQKGKVISGASTLTMQVSRLMKPKKRSFLNKILETLQAIKIEIKYTKQDILLFYLNHAPFGGNIIGIQAASWKYYQKPPERLTWGEAATLAVLPNAPGIISPHIDQKALIRKKNRLLKKLFEQHYLNKEEMRTALNEPVPDRVFPFVIKSPHFCRLLKDKFPSSIIHTNIDSDVQEICMTILKNHSYFLKQQGINNIAMAVAETKTGKIRAYAGSSDFFDDNTHGQVDGIISPRSTGSILKPFLYALSIDRGYLLPESMLLDIPTFYGAFTPSNADEKFSGVVRMKDALIQSLNIPAARTLQEFGVNEFHQFLTDSGVKHLQPPGNYGLTLILGGAECHLLDIISLYRGLGNNGQFSPLKFFEKESTDNRNTQLISQGAAWKILNVLKKLKRPGSDYYWELFQNNKPLAWKTGTSYGRRDAWAVGVSPEWTVGVWAGNFSGEGNPSIGGASTAGPVLFDIHNSLPVKNPFFWFPSPDKELSTVTICSDTGYQAGPSCRSTVEVTTPRNMPPLKQCPYHKKVVLSADKSESVCSLCWKAEEPVYENRLIYPPEVLHVFRQRGISFDTVPPHRKSCTTSGNVNPLSIIYPTPQSNIILPKDFGGISQKITFRASHMNPDIEVFWYLDDMFLGKTNGNHTISSHLKTGHYILTLVDENGNKCKISFSVVNLK